MKVIIAGGRNYIYQRGDIERLDLVKKKLGITEVVSGACGAKRLKDEARGADGLGEYWARTWLLPVKRFYADWDKHGRAAGPIRNREMARYVAESGGAVLLFPGGAGTEDMAEAAREFGLRVIRRVSYPKDVEGRPRENVKSI
jgi:hypothetical protein